MLPREEPAPRHGSAVPADSAPELELDAAGALQLAGRSEADLCCMALAGRMDAWGALVQRHDRRVLVALLARGLRIDQAKDVAQETWLRLIEQQRAGRLASLTLPGLAVAQATFLACDAVRKSARVRRVEGGDADDAATDVADPGADAEMRLIANQRLARAEAVLARCSPSARAVFRLAYGDAPLTHAEIAARVGLSTQRVRQIVCEVRKVLRAAIVEERS